MKIFFIGSKKTAEEYEQSMKVLKVVEEFGHQVDTRQMEISYEYETENVEDAYKNNYNSIKNSDTVIVEASGLSSGIGFLIATALNEKKPVLALYNRNSKPQSTVTLRSVKNKHFKFAEYDEKDLRNVLKNFLLETKSILDTKFILIIPAEIDRYLEWSSGEKRMHKAQIVREAVEKTMENDKEWKEYLKSI